MLHRALDDVRIGFSGGKEPVQWPNLRNWTLGPRLHWQVVEEVSCFFLIQSGPYRSWAAGANRHHAFLILVLPTSLRTLWPCDPEEKRVNHVQRNETWGCMCSWAHVVTFKKTNRPRLPTQSREVSEWARVVSVSPLLQWSNTNTYCTMFPCAWTDPSSKFSFSNIRETCLHVFWHSYSRSLLLFHVLAAWVSARIPQIDIALHCCRSSASLTFGPHSLVTQTKCSFCPPAIRAAFNAFGFDMWLRFSSDWVERSRGSGWCRGRAGITCSEVGNERRMHERTKQQKDGNADWVWRMVITHDLEIGSREWKQATICELLERDEDVSLQCWNKKDSLLMPWRG